MSLRDEVRDLFKEAMHVQGAPGYWADRVLALLRGGEWHDGAVERMLPTLRSFQRTSRRDAWPDEQLRVIGNELLAAVLGGEGL